ncbi:molybdenum cofactor biosynthesis protein B [Alloalcanivorax gelatiniphagus]|uniref:Molybdenum cofactor biosynthesis protein B n=1 Tax=Alloalcanivorax gelatiniphagus TaxID=1194167 RepID=A0ABY2XHR0_9GAMM|nr:molybdenum cofactor biosynthesis protein B [Alloalcanivorax gelatiniphagus]TMW11295.1 molybdenum cofactor biosynthesis protein B [Alloalcanivorax gelatiniphagus]|tara:strand:+ start:20529 stop:21047 length:519 start_codon:yes stop_codon:yes gene_type:complete
MSHHDTDFQPLALAVLTVSDTRTVDNDTSGDLLADRATGAGHKVVARDLVRDDIYQLRRVVSAWIADPAVQVVLVTGGTGFSGRDSTPEALGVLFDKHVEGFGELFRQVSLDEIGPSTIQSRCLAGVANGTLIFCLPGSNNACATGWDKIIANQLDSRTRPCNFAGLVSRGA